MDGCLEGSISSSTVELPFAVVQLGQVGNTSFFSDYHLLDGNSKLIGNLVIVKGLLIKLSENSSFLVVDELVQEVEEIKAIELLHGLFEFHGLGGLGFDHFLEQAGFVNTTGPVNGERHHLPCFRLIKDGADLIPGDTQSLAEFRSSSVDAGMHIVVSFLCVTNVYKTSTASS